MLIAFWLKTIEILLNAGDDGLCFALAVFLSEPLGSITSAFTVVAAIGITFVAMAQRHDVSGDSAGAAWRRQRNPMIHRQPVKQSRRSTTNGANTIKAFKGV